MSHDLWEPPHVHIDRDNLTAKFWLEPVSLARNQGFDRQSLRQIEGLVVQHRDLLLEAWNDFFRT